MSSWRTDGTDSADVATQSSSQWTLRQWADYVKSGTDPNGNSSKVYNIISLEVTGTELAKKVRAPQLVREIDWVDNFWHFPGGKGNVVDEKKQGVPADAPVTDGATDAVTPDLKAKGKAPSTWPKVQLYCLVRLPHQTVDLGTRLMVGIDGHEGILDRLARRLCGKLGVLYDTLWLKGVLLHQTYRAESQGVQRVYVIPHSTSSGMQTY